MSKLSELYKAVILIRSAGMNYTKFQTQETLGRVRIKNNKLQRKGKDYV